ncbi:MAG TPA: ornithine cyclodeaminase family protein [bacterium]|nr:ornithine cyclodeaminase family protein [bacterium]
MAEPRRGDGAPLLWLSRDDVTAALPPLEERFACIRDALVWISEGRAEVPPKFGVHPPGARHAHAMPALLPDGRGLGIKWLADFPNNKARGLPTVPGVIVLNDPANGMPLAIMDGTVVTAVRTAAVTALALSVCVRPTASVATIVGAGVEARSHLEVLPQVLPSLVRIWVVGREAHSAERLCAEMAGRVGPALTPTANREEAVRDADAVVTVTTNTTTPLLDIEWLKAGVTVVVLDNGGKEASILYRVDRVLVDDRKPFAGPEVLGRYASGVPPVAAEIGEVLLGRAPGRTTDRERILVLPLGIAACDIALAVPIYERAKARGLGTLLPL